jgi:hypothetical protein
MSNQPFGGCCGSHGQRCFGSHPHRRTIVFHDSRSGEP